MASDGGSLGPSSQPWQVTGSVVCSRHSRCQLVPGQEPPWAGPTQESTRCPSLQQLKSLGPFWPGPKPWWPPSRTGGFLALRVPLPGRSFSFPSQDKFGEAAPLHSSPLPWGLRLSHRSQAPHPRAAALVPRQSVGHCSLLTVPPEESRAPGTPSAYQLLPLGSWGPGWVASAAPERPDSLSSPIPKVQSEDTSREGTGQQDNCPDPHSKPGCGW